MPDPKAEMLLMRKQNHSHQGHKHRRGVEIARRETAKSDGLASGFSAFAARAANVVGSPVAFMAALIIILAWGVTGPLFHFSDTWQLIINTGTTIITFLMVFLIQNTQNRDAKAMNLKLNELVHALKGAHNELIDIEKLSDEELTRLDEYYQRVREECERRDTLKAKKEKTA